LRRPKLPTKGGSAPEEEEEEEVVSEMWLGITEEHFIPGKIL